MKTRLQRWHFTILLLTAYLAVLQSWTLMDRRSIVVSGLLATAVLGALLAWFARRQYFANRWDVIFHAAVVVDILLEALLVKHHDNLGFVFCAAAFAVALGGYRAWVLATSRGAPCP